MPGDLAVSKDPLGSRLRGEIGKVSAPLVLPEVPQKMVKYALDGLDNNIQRQERRSGADAA